MNIYLIRHGRQASSLCNVDVQLSEEGIQQAKLLKDRIELLAIDAVYSSNLIRAVETASILNEGLMKPHIVRENLKEIDFGLLTGQTDCYISEHFSEFNKEKRKLLEDLPFPGGECGTEVFSRAYPIIEEIVNSGYESVMVITHGGVIRSLSCGILGLGQEKKLAFGIELENCSITQLSWHKKYEYFTLERFNDCAHLEPFPELMRNHWKTV